MKRPKEKIITVDRSALTFDEAMQSRVGLDESTLERYADALKAGATFPPLRAVKCGKILLVFDGWHRGRLYERNKVNRVKVAITIGTRDDALKLAAGANFDHGLPRSAQDRERSVLMLLELANREKWATNKLAEFAHVSFAFADRIRKENADIDERVGRNGQTYKTKPKADPAHSRESAPDDETPEIPTDPESLEGLGDATEPVKMPRGRVEDAYDRLVPERLTEVFVHRRELNAIALELAKTKTRLLTALRHSSGASKRISLANAEKNIEDTIRSIRVGMPDAVCPECNGEPPNQDSTPCQFCDDDGWLHESRVTSLPNRLRKITQQHMRKGA